MKIGRSSFKIQYDIDFVSYIELGKGCLPTRMCWRIFRVTGEFCKPAGASAWHQARLLGREAGSLHLCLEVLNR